MKTNIVIIAGRKQSGKDTSAQYLIEKIQEDKGSNSICKQYSFAKPLKDFLVNVMGLTHDQCWGTDQAKNTLTNISWYDLSFSEEEIIRHLLESRDPVLLKQVSSNPWLVQDGMAMLQRDNVKMTAREVMQIFGSNVCRRMSPNCWANATLQKIIKEQPDYAFITDARFPNELDIFLPYNPIVIRLSRNLFNSQHVSEVALDKYPWQNIQRFIPIDNVDMDLDNKNSLVYTEFLKYKG